MLALEFKWILRRSILQKYYQQAAAEYYGNVTEFIGTGEGRELTRLETLRIRTKYPAVEDWYESLNLKG
jgi:hypothetical protein